MKPDKRHSKYQLYWVASDGDEDCFVVARNSRSAACFDIDFCGFGPGQAAATRVMSIAPAVIAKWESRHRRQQAAFELPWYADDWLLRQVGAEFRSREGLEETLIGDVVYTRGGDGPIEPRTIGRKGIDEFRSVAAFRNYGHEDRYSPSQMTIFTILGICVARVQEIEELISHSFVFSAMAPSERRLNLTIGESIDRWNRKTLGQMLKTIDEGFEIHPKLQEGFRLFLEMRNRLVHGITTSEQFNIRTGWGQAELICYLPFFEIVSRLVRNSFEASLYASIDIGNTYLRPDNPIVLTKRQQKKTGLFAFFFTPKRVTAEDEHSPTEIKRPKVDG
jgi:hypothetical protein